MMKRAKLEGADLATKVNTYARRSPLTPNKNRVRKSAKAAPLLLSNSRRSVVAITTVVIKLERASFHPHFVLSWDIFANT